jgi:hypothetical protein
MMPPICPDCCPEEATCEIFVGGPFTDLTGLTEIGTVSIVSSEAVLETGEGLITDNGPTNATDPVHLEVVTSTTDNPATLRMMVAADDEDNGFYAEYTINSGTGTLEVGRRVSGTNTPYVTPIEVEDTSQLGDSTTFVMCWIPGEVQEGASYEVTCDAITKTSFGSWDDPPTLYTFAFSETAPPVTYEFFPCLFGIDPGSTIDGIAVQIECSLDMPNDVQLTEVELLVEGVAVGSQNPNSTVTGTPIGDSGTLTDWGAAGDITWENISTLAVAFTFTAGATAGGAQLTIADATVQVDYTTPDRQPGRLTISRNNVTVATIDCSREYSAEAPSGTGKKAVVFSVDGEWPIESMVYSYHLSDTKPTCPECECTTADAEPCACCDEGPPPFTLLADFGAGGWTNSDCGDYCSEIAGEYGVNGSGECLWIYSETTLVEGTGCNKVIVIHLIGSSPETCVWRLEVLISEFAAGVMTDSMLAIYESEAIADCHTFPVTLTKLFDGATGLPSPACGGALPNTIPLDIP